VNSSAAIAVELVLVLGAALGWGIWEILSLRREKRRAERAAQAPAADQTGARGT
jgi:hypothetical protein